MDQVSERACALGERPEATKPLPLIVLEAAAACLVSLLVILLASNVVARYGFNHSVKWVDGLSHVMFLWVTMLGSVLAVIRFEHIRLSVFFDAFSPENQRIASVVGKVISLTLLLGLILPSTWHAIAEHIFINPNLNAPNSIRSSAMPVGIVLMAIVISWQLVRDASYRSTVFTFIAVAGVSAALWLVKPFILGLGNYNLLIFLVSVTGMLLVIGVPIAFCFATATLAYLTFGTNIPIQVMIGRMDEGMANPGLLSVLLFVLLGCVMDASGVGRAIVSAISSLVGHLRAGMSYALLGSLFLVSGISGSKVADMATVAPALFPEMKRRGNKPSEMVALLGTGAIMADTVPPSIVLIVIGSILGISIGALFASGFIVAMYLLLTLMIVARIRERNGEKGSRQPLRLIAGVFATALPALLLPFLIRGLVSEGVATATEVATLAVIYVVIAGALFYGGISLKRFYALLVESASLAGAIMLILGAALAMAWCVTQSGFARDIAQSMGNLPGGWITFMGVTIIIYLVLGCLLEGLPAIVLMAPLTFPIASNLGIDPIQYAMVIVLSVNIGLFTPPIGVGFYIACSIGKVSPRDALGAIWPYLGGLLVGLALIALFPMLSTWML